MSDEHDPRFEAEEDQPPAWFGAGLALIILIILLGIAHGA